MGPFLVEPLVADLRAAAESAAPLHDARCAPQAPARLPRPCRAGHCLLGAAQRAEKPKAAAVAARSRRSAPGSLQRRASPAHPTPPHCRRLLEVLVPLVYRPAIKAALLDAELVPVLADILGGRAGG